MFAVLEVFVRLADQFDEGFVNQRGGLQRVAWILSRHIAMSHLAQFSLYQSHQLLQSQLIAIAPICQKFCDFVRRCGHRLSLFCVDRNVGLRADYRPAGQQAEVFGKKVEDFLRR